MSSNRNIIVQVFRDFISTIDITTQEFREIPSNFDITTKTGFNQLSFYLPTMVNLSQVKAMVLMAEEEIPSSSEAYKFRFELEEFCKKRGIFFYLSNRFYFLTCAVILKSKTLVKNGEKVAVLFSVSDTSPTGVILVREDDCYRILEAVFENSSYSEEWKVRFLQKTKPTKVLITGFKTKFSVDYAKILKDLFKEYKPFVTIEDAYNKKYMQAAVVDKILHLMGDKSSPYDITTMCPSRYNVCYGEKSLFKTFGIIVSLPMEKSFIVDVDPSKTVTFIDERERPPKVIQETKLALFKSKKVKVILTLDINAFYHFKVEAYDEEESKMPNLEAAKKTLDSEKKEPDEAKLEKSNSADSVPDKLSSPEKARFIFDKQNFSVYVFEAEKECMIKDVDGLDKTPIYISFVEEKPVIGKVAKEMCTDKPKYVVFDLIKLCSTTDSDIVNPKWRFSLSKDDDEALMVNMQTFEDERRARVAFLLAMILKNGNDRIKKNYGKRMKEFEIGFNGFQPNETLKKNFIEAGNLLKIGIVFV